MKNLAVSNWSLLLAFALVLIAVVISTKEHLGLSKDIFISVARAIVQLVVVGFILKAIFKINNVWLTIVMTMIIIFNAAWNANQRDPNPHRHFWQSVVAEAVGTYLTLGTLVASGTIKLTPVQVIPITGMIAGNEMVAVGLCFKALHDGFHDQRQQVLEKLALGADRQQASHTLMRRAIKTGMQPTIDSIKTVGLVNLPGMMSGLIFAGVDPVYAIRYQIMVSFMLLSASSLGSVIACYLAYRNYFNKRLQLLID
jgi:putative ABC transport system permease protein